VNVALAGVVVLLLNLDKRVITLLALAAWLHDGGLHAEISLAPGPSAWSSLAQVEIAAFN
jgi:hypothetical protein